ncbi:MAG: hypothetical protein IKC31_05145 [Clostridia bacterium]|nr:hypothetical protein [Clostridia bacterium]
MKNRKLLKLLAAILCFSVLLVTFTACATGTQKDKKNAISKLYNKEYEDEVSVPVSIKNLGDLGVVKEARENFVVFQKQTENGVVTSVYSSLTNSVIMSDTSAEPMHCVVDFPIYYKAKYFVVFKATHVTRDNNDVSPFGEISMMVYDARGNVIKTLEQSKLQPTIDGLVGKPSSIYPRPVEEYYWVMSGEMCKPICEGYVQIDKTVYGENEDGTLTAVKEFKFNSVPTIDREYEGYFYHIVGKSEVFVYDKDFNLTARYNVPSFAQGAKIHTLNNGNVFIQYYVTLPIDAAAYDLSSGTVKYDLVTEILSVKDGTIKKIDAKYVLNDLTARNNYNDVEEDYFSDKWENCATVYFIGENKTMDTNSSALEYVLLDNEGGIDAFLSNDRWDNQSIPDMLNKNLFQVKLLNGDVELFNAKGETLCVLGPDIDLLCNDQYFTDGNVIYDLSGAEVYNLKANGMEIFGSRDICVILIKETKESTTYYRFANGTVSQIVTINEEDDVYVEFKDRHYCIEDAEGNFVYYNYEGVVLCKLSVKLTESIDSEDGYLLYGTDGSAYVFLYEASEEK